ncbi:MAG: hypothetical protein L6Q54_06985 [Leptospiraceae bacterium]|nr:hypothetical protein [Leptospiraceae bacterium]MCK6380983.1 hypothetical protein [Leptospiraceae bacterium]NUM40264.1 hypothetical protein [Leptospiraceae bacterium]
MKNKNLLIYIVIGVAVLLVAILFFVPGEKEKKKTDVSVRDKIKISTKGVVIDDPYFPDAPHPSSEDPKLEAEAERLWPHALKPGPTDKDREKIREEWNRFSAKYPKNLYIPNEYKPPQTEKEAEQIRKELDVFTEVDASFASQIAANKYAEPGSEMKTPNEPKVTPEQQATYFSYKIRELESRIQLVEFMMESGEIDQAQSNIAKNDLAVWRKELETLRKIAKQVPAS